MSNANIATFGISGGDTGGSGSPGPQGPPGEDGLDGAPGEQGDPGEQGPIGPQGPQGTAGTPGAAGAQGIQGPPGSDGLEGEPGIDGLPGVPGPQGPTGATGSPGATGPQGMVGPPGADGLDGQDGLDGFSIPGPQGPQGVTGATGSQGFQGLQGAPGFDGIDGQDGLDSLIPGPTGPAGAGASGFTQGSVIFASPAGTLTQDNANFFWDDTNDKLGIGTNVPSEKINVKQIGDVGGPATVLIEEQSDTPANSPSFRANRTRLGPAALLNGDRISQLEGRGYGTTALSGNRVAVRFTTTEDWTDAAQGCKIIFRTTPNGTTTTADKVTITGEGNVGIGTTTPIYNEQVQDDGTSSGAIIDVDSYQGATGNRPTVQGRAARGTVALPTKVLSNDGLLLIGGTGYEEVTPGFGATNKSRIGFFAQEDWTNVAQGAFINFSTTPSGSTSRAERMRVSGEGILIVGGSAPSSQVTVYGLVTQQNAPSISQTIAAGFSAVIAETYEVLNGLSLTIADTGILTIT